MKQAADFRTWFSTVLSIVYSVYGSFSSYNNKYLAEMSTFKGDISRHIELINNLYLFNYANLVSTDNSYGKNNVD